MAVHDSDVTFLLTPAEFYQTLLRLTEDATERVNIATLYIGNSELELKLLQALRGKPAHILLDGLRGNRKDQSGLSSVEMIHKHCPTANVSQFTTPLFTGLFTKLPDRIREIVGTQHMKLFVADNTVVVTGANLSDIYFTNRQDRYVVIRNKQLADCVTEVILSQGRASVETPVSEGLHLSHSVQRGFEMPGTGQNDSVTENLLSELANQDAQVTISSPYLNLAPAIWNGLMNLENVNIVTNSVETNAFFNSKGPSRFIPDAYAILQEDLMSRIDSKKVKVWEYSRSGWSFHAKGLWVKRPDGGISDTIIGSSNFGYRSQLRDLEISFRLQTSSHRVQDQLNRELEDIMTFCRPAALNKRHHPVWLKYLTRGPLRTFL